MAQDKAALYIFRNEGMGAGVKMDVLIDGAPVGQTAALTFIYSRKTQHHLKIRKY